MVVRDEGRRGADVVVMQRIKFLDVFIFDCPQASRFWNAMF